MSTEAVRDVAVPPSSTEVRPWLDRIDKRYLAPVLVTIVLLAGQLTFGFLESWSRTALAIATAILVELFLARVISGRWPHLASSYISGISIGMNTRNAVSCRAPLISSRNAFITRLCASRCTLHYAPDSLCAIATTRFDPGVIDFS